MIRRRPKWLIAVLLTVFALSLSQLAQANSASRSPTQSRRPDPFAPAQLDLIVRNQTGTTKPLKAKSDEVSIQSVGSCNWSSAGTPRQNYYDVRVDVECIGAAPYDVIVTFYKANVNTPGTLTQIDRQPQNCAGANPCSKVFTSPYIGTTMWVKAKSEIWALSGDGQLMYGDSCCLAYVWNDLGTNYPVIPSTRGGEIYVPFYGPPAGQTWRQCEDNPSITSPPACWRDPNYHVNVENYYAQNGWPHPTYEHEVHHIRPLFWGGGNSVGKGVILSPTNHQPFTSWWNYFSDRT